MERLPDCRVETALEILTGKWKPKILLSLITNGTMRFSELKRNVPNITQKMLTAQLRELEINDIVRREVFQEVPPRVEYSLTDYGRTLMPVLDAMNAWGEQHARHMSAERVEQTP
ncbi:winged helix-turn-helix transcriptional regulator [Exiguobacterium flavidum]|uniref:winged helix-turn-helix transcriptional regulator n=1 Tax=Exiguobacterium flavidum TaxID=2184695 RepID=UPI000DF814A7|nr:helix-turn-helix domain-containing protein [Exiguobacterium flavidum]